MPDKLCILTCANFEPELRAVLSSEGFDDVTGSCFPSTCGRPRMTWENIGQIQGDLGDFAKIHVLGCYCLREMVNPPETLAHTVIHRMAQCFDLVASPTFTDGYLKSGNYILTSGQALRWRQWLDSLGLDKETARQMFGESISRLLLLDTGVSAQAREELEHLADFVGLPYEIIPIGLDFCRLFINRIVSEYRLEFQKRMSDEVSKKTSSETANYAMALDLLSGLTPAMTETDVIEKVTDLMKMLFAARTVNYLPLTGQESAGWISFLIPRYPEAVDEDAQGSDDYLWSASGNGFSIPIKGRDAHVGILIIDDITFPEHKERYLNLALQIVGVFGLAVENARTYQQMTLTQNRLRESEEKFRTVADFTYDWEYWVAPDGSLIYNSPSCERITGYHPEEFLNNPKLITEIVHPEDSSIVVNHLDLTDSDDHHAVDFRIFTHSGQERWIEHRSQPVFGDDGRWLGRRASNRDITYRKQVEEEKSSLIIELQNALAQVKKLSGFIPICSSCKKIRDDKGYWRQVEEYVSEHSEALFSHGICPDCIRKLYPEIADEVLGRLEKDKKK